MFELGIFGKLGDKVDFGKTLIAHIGTHLLPNSCYNPIANQLIYASWSSLASLV